VRIKLLNQKINLNIKLYERQYENFDEKKVRTVWDEESEEWYFSIIDVIQALTDTERPRKYRNDLKKKLQKEGSELSEKIGQLKMLAADGKMYKTDVANTEELLRLIQSITSPRAEPFKLWIAEVARQGGEVARNARLELEAKTGEKVISPLINAKKGILKNENKEIE